MSLHDAPDDKSHCSHILVSSAAADRTNLSVDPVKCPPISSICSHQGQLEAFCLHLFHTSKIPHLGLSLDSVPGSQYI